MGNSEDAIREALFDPSVPGRDFLNRDCRIYREIAEIARLNQGQPALRFGRMYFREISGNGTDFGLPEGQPCTLAFSRLLARHEVLVAYNTSATDAREDLVMVDNGLHQVGDGFRFLYGGAGSLPVIAGSGPAAADRCLRLRLEPMQFVVLARQA